jgi:hypothetical protein
VGGAFPAAAYSQRSRTYSRNSCVITGSDQRRHCRTHDEFRSFVQHLLLVGGERLDLGLTVKVSRAPRPRVRGGPSSIQGYSDEYPLFLAKHFVYSVCMNYSGYLANSSRMSVLLVRRELLRSNHMSRRTPNGPCNSAPAELGPTTHELNRKYSKEPSKHSDLSKKKTKHGQ